MARPGNGPYTMFCPPLPWPVTVYVTDAGMRIPGISGPTLYLWSEAGQAYAIAHDCYATCDDAGHWTVVKGDKSLSGTCSPA